MPVASMLLNAGVLGKATPVETRQIHPATLNAHTFCRVAMIPLAVGLLHTFSSRSTSSLIDPVARSVDSLSLV